MTKGDIVAKVAKEVGLPKGQTQKVIDAFLKTIAEGLGKGEKITFVGFGTFYVAERAERKGRNPQTGKEIVIPAAKVPRFRPGKLLKEAVK